MTDQELILLIQNGKNEMPVKRMYQEFPKIERLIVQSGGNKQLAEEIFNDSLLLFLEKVRDVKFEQQSKLTTFFYGINRYLMLNELRKQQKHGQSLEWSDTLIITDADLDYDFEKERKLDAMERILSRLSEKCKSILEFFYFKKWSMEQIAAELNYSSVNSAKTQKYKCIEQASKMAVEFSIHNANTAKS